ncbi:MAG TPA: sigma-54 dependent transcriptional regulator [Acidisarcina sp.]|nr:sigma-54 dependent transcriptional regulator [Acidisarcina sp.]
MPEHKQIKALLAVSRPAVSGPLRAYFHARGDSVEEVSPSPVDPVVERVSVLRPDLVVLELDGSIEALETMHRCFRTLPVVVFAPTSPEIAFAAARLGAVEILSFPLGSDELASKLNRVTARLADAPSRDAAPSRNAGNPSNEVLEDFPRIFSSSPRMMQIHDTINKVANTSATVLIRGESGVGKEIAARMIYALSERSHGPYIKLNCAAIPGDLLESELFGYESGAFTGAVRSKPGKFELADGGTLFLDEIGEMEPRLQAKLLHVLQDGQFSRLGAKGDVAVDVRVICATNQILEQRVAEGSFREDLFYRINVITISVPPLRERREEIPILIRYFLERYARVYQRTLVPLDPKVLDFLCDYSWPGNIRELENLCKRYVIVGDPTQIVRELSAHKKNENPVQPPQPAETAPASIAGDPSLLEIGHRAAWLAERAAIREMLVETRWNRREAARRLKVSYKALLNKIRVMEVESKG